ncbi:diguanylate cyclase [Actinoplanes sp. KI2]|uniref:diguanylate cyclase n=1 Tax=Actinoplanes sp. KI2 TaxID=2983315 RepID=UPI0021D5A3C0|nr:diguanylate cyclase [Actinoplanes sp. KI2]MCU7727602.1 diguanylate cyclase [Actinoplanes sp. KI2]
MSDKDSVRRAAELTDLVVDGELGRGAFTTVHRVRRGDDTYALKRPNAERADDPGLLIAFQREAALLACIDDPGVPLIHAAGRFDGAPAMVLEFLPGGSLADTLAHGPLPAGRVVELAGQLGHGLAAAHRVGLVHRDVKPGNIMMPPGRPAKLIDFGLAQLGAEQGDDDRAIGTFLYTSPEQSGMLKRPVDGRSDLYSLGVVLFECLTGRLPFEADDVGELLRLHLTAPVPDLVELCPGLDPALAAVVTRLLGKDPDDRYPDAAAFLSALPGEAGGTAAASIWPLCGRDAERAQLAARWDRARAGHGGIAVVRGPAGSGRTRLAQEAVTLADDVPVLRAGCLEDEALPLATLRTAIDGYLQAIALLAGPARAEAEQRVQDAAAVAGPALVARVIPRLEAMVGEAGAAEARDDHVFAAVATFLAELAKAHKGLLLICDDAHCLDAGSRAVLEQLVPDLAGLPVLVLLTERDGAGVPVAVHPDLEIDCMPLEPPAVAALIASRLPGAAVPADLVAHITGRTDGTPLAVVAYLLRLLDAGLLSPLWGTWHFDAAGADALPAADDVRALLASRLATLAEADREVLVVAAVAGSRFRTETLIAAGGPADRVVAAVGAAVERRIVEVRPGGWYVFLHPMLRESLLEGVGEQRLRRLHASLADALESLPSALQDPDNVYAVARHHRRAGDEVPAEARRRSALAAGLRALADLAPDQAVGYLEQALDGDPAPETAVLHPLALAYLRASRYAEAGATIERALVAETDRRARAHLLITEIELHHTLWDDEKALAATAAALTEVGRPLPRKGVALLASTIGIGLAGGAVRRTGWGFGTAAGQRRDDLATLAAALDAGGYAAAVGLRLREAGVLTMRAMYAVNRLGPCPEYVRVYALVGYVAAVTKLRGTADRCLDRATSVANDLGDPALVAYVEWVRGCALLFGGFDDGTAFEEAITRNARWFGPAQLLPGHATIGIRLLLRGYAIEAEAEYERGLRRLGDPKLIRGTSFSMLSVMIPAMLGRPGESAAALADLRAALPPGKGTTVQRANMLVAAACAAVEQGEFGEPFEAIAAEFQDLGLRLRDMMTQHKWFYVYQAQARMTQIRMATEQLRPARIAAAREALADLRRVRKSSPLLDAAYLLATGAFAQQLGELHKAIEWTDKAEHVARMTDAPLVHFEVARIRARSFRALGLTHESDRQARIAISLAGFHGWESRRRQARTEFAAEEGSATNRRTVVGRSDAPRNRRLEALQQVAAAAATVLDPQELARVALDEMLRILGAERALFFLLDEAGEPVPFAGRGADGTDLEPTTAYGATLVRRVAFGGEPLVLTGTEQGAALGSRSAVVHGLRSIMVVPVQFKGNTLGVVYLDSRMARGIFTDNDVEVLIGVTSHVAVSLETARAAQLHLAVAAAQQQQAFAEMLRSSLAELSGIHDPSRLLSVLFGMLASQLNASSGCLLSADGSVVTEVVGKVDPAVLGGPFPAALPSVLTAAVVPAGDIPEISGQTLLVVPLDSRDGRSGLVVLGADDFDETAIQIASSLATQGMSAYLNACLFSRVQELATTDELTGQHNRRHFYAIATALVSAAARGSRDLAAVMLDIDKFKSVNDTYGHGVGDEVIREVAARVRASIRRSDVLGRYGGEEFAVVLPDHHDAAPDLAERMRHAVADTPIPTAAGPLPITISVGLTQLEPGDASLDQVLARADLALYRAKESGRNRVVVC